MESNNLMRMLVGGAILAIVGIGLFLFLYFVVFAGQPAVIQLFASMLLPPLVIGVGLGVYYLIQQSD